MKAKRWYYGLLLAAGISATLLLNACGQGVSDETGIDESSEWNREASSDTEGNASTKESSELNDNAKNEDADTTTNDILNEEPPEPANEEIMGWTLEGTCIYRNDQNVHTVPCVYEGKETVGAAFVSESSAYVAYFSAEEKNAAVDYTHDGGATWETTYVHTENSFHATMRSFYFSFWDEMEGCLLCCSDPAMGQMAKVLCCTTDGGKSFELVEDLSELHNYPKGLAFCERDRGLIITDYHGYDSYAYLTEDGGKIWSNYEVKELDADSYSYVEGISIQKDASTDAWELVLRGVSDDRNLIYCTSADNWKTWQIQ